MNSYNDIYKHDFKHVLISIEYLWKFNKIGILLFLNTSNCWYIPTHLVVMI